MSAYDIILTFINSHVKPFRSIQFICNIFLRLMTESNLIIYTMLYMHERKRTIFAFIRNPYHIVIILDIVVIITTRITLYILPQVFLNMIQQKWKKKDVLYYTYSTSTFGYTTCIMYIYTNISSHIEL